VVVCRRTAILLLCYYAILAIIKQIIIIQQVGMQTQRVGFRHGPARSPSRAPSIIFLTLFGPRVMKNYTTKASLTKKNCSSPHSALRPALRTDGGFKSSEHTYPHLYWRCVSSVNRSLLLLRHTLLSFDGSALQFAFPVALLFVQGATGTHARHTLDQLKQ